MSWVVVSPRRAPLVRSACHSARRTDGRGRSVPRCGAAHSPQALPRGLEGALDPVLDPSGGTGTTTTTAAAKAPGRVGISADISPTYIRLAAWHNTPLPGTDRRRAASRR
ncbi:hypothetical protein GCM10010302_06450 [Streptomyces polychromogenes]|uniref:DNA methylase N-4/N-6 domain-containing protein n=1 Tax=Streptomyces polychromogenes TaxID=67342 RepID=A0ABN0V268_9ACTN